MITLAQTWPWIAAYTIGVALVAAAWWALVDRSAESAWGIGLAWPLIPVIVAGLVLLLPLAWAASRLWDAWLRRGGGGRRG